MEDAAVGRSSAPTDGRSSIEASEAVECRRVCEVWGEEGDVVDTSSATESSRRREDGVCRGRFRTASRTPGGRVTSVRVPVRLLLRVRRRFDSGSRDGRCVAGCLLWEGASLRSSASSDASLPLSFAVLAWVIARPAP